MAVEVKSKISSFDIKYRITSRLICKQILPDICFNQNDCEWGRITAVWRILKFSNTKFYKIPSNILIQTAMDVVRLLKNRIINHRIFDRKKYVGGFFCSSVYLLICLVNKIKAPSVHKVGLF
mgnify:FL=1